VVRRGTGHAPKSSRRLAGSQHFFTLTRDRREIGESTELAAPRPAGGTPRLALTEVWELDGSFVIVY
jgi:hypothetical protein